MLLELSYKKKWIIIRLLELGRLLIQDVWESEILWKKKWEMAETAAEIIRKNVFYANGKAATVIIYEGSIATGEEAARCEAEFTRQNVVATLSVTPSWCYPLETIDLDPLTIKAIWGFNGTERPGAVYLAAALAAHNQMKLPCFSIYGKDVQNMQEGTIPKDVEEKILRFARCAIAVGQMKNKSYVGFGSVSMGIMGSFLDPSFYIHYLGIRPEWVDMTEILRRIDKKIYDHEEVERALLWVKKYLREGKDPNPEVRMHTREMKDSEWKKVVQMTVIIRDIMLGSEKLAALGFEEEALGRNALFAGFQGQRMWTDYQPNADFTETIMNSSFSWNGKKQPRIFATENDNLNGLSMLFGNLLTGRASGFSDIRCYWSPEAVKKVTGWTATGKAQKGFIHLINSGSTCMDATGKAKEDDGKPVMKKWWEMKEDDIHACLRATDWCPAELCQFRGGWILISLQDRCSNATYYGKS